MTSLSTPISLSEFTADAFGPHLGQQFRFRTEEAAVELELIQVQRQKSPWPAGTSRREPFSLLFKLRGGRALNDQLLQVLEHPDFEAGELLLTRVLVPEFDLRDGSMFYEAVFG